ncbi:cyclic AMP-dependent transcription factor ATF-7 isoform X2 [Pygocentrus nattereri]|uniref:cyclic AMP-dependent transcription factor ATF-7 isoform X2 n=1 Tax=Pygocentrus nattereri TaxID=42514 RepID=UPI0018910E99|nr:cyclic AMP-dependent transcription factor ATF-7 isoform X2 [Pygocentrus nattereri]
MNDDQDRPYVCTAPGCTQCFQREDHLIIHRHKHEMTLKFPSIKCENTLSDQTPTPTRFLRNCEEVGLFSDLELDQTTEDEEEDARQNFAVQHSSVLSQPPDESQRQHHQFQPQQPQQQQCSLAQLHDSHLHAHTSQPTSHCSMARQPTHSTANTQSAPSCLHSKQRLPAACAMQGTSTMHMNTQLSMDTNLIGIPGPAHSASGPTHQISPILKNAPCSQSPPHMSGGRRRRTADDDPDERRRKFLERNRAAASRCRQKRKVWVTSLEKKAEELTHTNLQLQNEVTLLRSEVTQLKQILLAHKDCPVTARQRETHGGSPTGSPIQAHTVQLNSISTTSTPTAHTHLTAHAHSAS